MVTYSKRRRVARSGFSASVLVMIVAVMMTGCGVSDVSVSGSETRDVFRNHIERSGRRYELITPTGVRIMDANLQWEREQEQPANARSYAQPAQCARNISKIFEMAGLARYQSPLVPELVDLILSDGGLVVRLPGSSEGITNVVAQRFGGRIPVGTVIAGCRFENCGGQAGDGHVAIVGDVTFEGALKAYHNNWYRPDNENGTWKEHMIPLEWYKRGFRRKFMWTPWLTILRGGEAGSRPIGVRVELPAIDDLDPTNYFVTLALPAEIRREAGI